MVLTRVFLNVPFWHPKEQMAEITPQDYFKLPSHITRTDSAFFNAFMQTIPKDADSFLRGTLNGDLLILLECANTSIRQYNIGVWQKIIPTRIQQMIESNGQPHYALIDVVHGTYAKILHGKLLIQNEIKKRNEGCE